MENKKTSGLFMKACLVIAAIWLLAVAAVVIYFHAINRPLDSVVVAFLFSPGIGELGFSSLIKAAKEKSSAESAETKAAALQAELDTMKPKPAKRGATPTQETEAAKTAVTPREQKQARSMLEQMLPSLVTEAERACGGGTGPLKLSYVLEKAYDRLPDACKMLFTSEQMGSMVDKALAIAKVLWAENPTLLGN